MNKILENKKSKENSSGAANTGNSKNKESKQKKKDQQSNINYSANKIHLWSAPTADRMVTSQLSVFRNPRGGATKAAS